MLLTSVKLAFFGPIGFEDDLRFPILLTHGHEGPRFGAVALAVVSADPALLECSYKAGQGIKGEKQKKVVISHTLEESIATSTKWLTTSATWKHAPRC